MFGINSQPNDEKDFGLALRQGAPRALHTSNAKHNRGQLRGSCKAVQCNNLDKIKRATACSYCAAPHGPRERDRNTGTHRAVVPRGHKEEGRFVTDVKGASSDRRRLKRRSHTAGASAAACLLTVT
jgi:hypothetical protein